MPTLRLPQMRLQVQTVVNARGDAEAMAQNGYIDVVGGAEETTLLNVSAVSLHPTACTSSMHETQFILATQDPEIFEFPAAEYEIGLHPHLGLAVTVYINKGTDTPQHTIASIAYANFDKLMQGHSMQLESVLTDVRKTPMRIMIQANVTPQQLDWNKHNEATLRELSSNFNAVERVEERLYAFAAERASALKDYLDPDNQNTVHSKLGMQMNCVRHVMNVELADNAQTEFFKEACADECPDFMLKYAPLSAAMLLATAVKFIHAKDNCQAPLSYTRIHERLSGAQLTEQDAELWTQIFDNCLTSIVPACNSYVGDASWLVNTNGVSVIPRLVGEEQLLLGSPAVQALEDLNACNHLSSLCQELLGNGQIQKAELAFAAAHTARLKTCELGKSQDCEDFAADFRHYRRASRDERVMTQVAAHMVGTAQLCADARLNVRGNTVPDARNAVLVCCATQRYAHELTPYTSQDCVCIAMASNLTSRYSEKIDEPVTQQIVRRMFDDRDSFLLASTPGAAGHCCALRAKSSKMHTLQLKYDVTAHLHDTHVMCMQESTSSTIFREQTEAPDQFDVEIQVGLGATRKLNGMPRSVVKNIAGSIFSDMLTTAGLHATHASDRIGSQGFYKVLSAVGGRSVLACEHRSTGAALAPTDVLKSIAGQCKNTDYYFGAEQSHGPSIITVEFDLKPAEQRLLRMLARAQAPLYTKSMKLVLASASFGSCFLPRLDCISHHLPGNVHVDSGQGKQLFVLAQKAPLLPMMDVLKTKSVDGLIDAHKERVRDVMRETCKSDFSFFSDHISTDIILLHTHGI
jgi:hypothetical protein